MLNVVSDEDGEWSSVGPSDCCDPPPNFPPDALLGQEGYHVDSVVIAAPDVDVEAFLAGLDSNMSPIASTTALMVSSPRRSSIHLIRPWVWEASIQLR